MEFHDSVAARTIWGESRGEGPIGMGAVAHVILNRLNSGRWGTTVAEVCLSPKQFSCWNESDPNRRKLLRLIDADLALQLRCWIDAQKYPDQTHGATHYKVQGVYAKWAEGHEPCLVVGHHEFYNDIP